VIIAGLALCAAASCRLSLLYSSVAIGNPERHMRKASHCGSKQQWSSHAMITLRVR